jgi:integrase
VKFRDVRVWEIRVNKDRKKRTYTVRWSVAGRPRSKTFGTRALADQHRSELMQAANRGEAFDTDTGLPESLSEPDAGETWLEFAVSYVAMKWPGAAAKSRTATLDALATVTPILTPDIPGRPDVEFVRHAALESLLPRNRATAERSVHLDVAVRWLEQATLPLGDLMDAAVIRRAVDGLSLRLDGRPVAATTFRRKRAVFYNALQYAVELERLPFNPLDKLRVRSRRTKVVLAVDRRVVVNPEQARELLTAVSYVGSRVQRGQRLVAFFACLYFGALRPAEALGLRVKDCELPSKGWGRLTLEKSRPQSGRRWTDSGESHDDRGLKHRGEDEPRVVPVPPELVAILKFHLDTFGVGPDGRLFRSLAGNSVGSSSYSRVWDEARRYALAPNQVDSPLAGRPYDLRHAAVSLWLNVGVPAPEVAERAGHSVDVLLKVYAKCIDGQEALVNARIEQALRGGS